MKNWFLYLFWGVDPEKPNALSGLSRRDVRLVQRSWKPLFRNCVSNGIELFTRFFRANPAARSYFRMLKNAREGQYAEVLPFRAHVINMMTTLNIAIGHLKEPEVVRDIMRKLGDAHNQKKIDKQNFDVFKSVFITMLGEQDFNEATMDAWNRTLSFFYTHIYDNLERNQGPQERGESYIYENAESE